MRKHIPLLVALAAFSGTSPAFAQSSLSIGAVVMGRGADAGTELLIPYWDGTYYPALIASDDLGFSMGGGLEASLNTEIAGIPFDLRVLHVPNMASSVALDDVVVTGSFGQRGISNATADPNGSGIFYGGDITADISASRDFGLSSFEANAQFAEFHGFQFTGGVRSFRLSDALFTHIDGTKIGLGDVSFDHTADVTNRLFGAQVGVNGDLAVGERATVSFFGAAGVFRNNASLDVGRMGYGLFSGTENSASTSGMNWTFGGEVGVNAGIAVTENASINVGYSAIYFSNVANAVLSFAASQIAGEVPVLDYGSALYHGAHVGFSFTF